MYNDIEIIERKDVNLTGALMIEGFPSVGMVSSIVANYLIKTLNMEYIGSVRSRHFQPVSVISGGRADAAGAHLRRPTCGEEGLHL